VSVPAEGANVDPVCGMTVDVTAARADNRIVDHAGRVYAFCSNGCRLEFEESPETYAEPGAEVPASIGPDGDHGHPDPDGHQGQRRDPL
jgi:YHS domain-containing protein